MKSDILIARINDTFDIAQKTNKPKFLGFLSREEIALAQRVLQNRNADFTLFGGFDGAERQMLLCKPDWCEEADFPITAVTFSYRAVDTLKHRDFLGALMALGITRESIGDILVENGRAVAFFKDEVLDFVKSNVSKIGRVGVELSIGFKEPLPQSSKLVLASSTVSSLRLDCVVSAVADISRNKAEEFINLGYVSVNSVVCEKTTKQIADGDVVSIRSKGKFIINSTSKKSKKDRIILEFKKYF